MDKQKVVSLVKADKTQSKAPGWFNELPPETRLNYVTCKAQEALVKQERIASLVTAIQNYIDPHHDGEPELAPKGENAEAILATSRHLIAILQDEVSDYSRHQDLIECLEAM